MREYHPQFIAQKIKYFVERDNRSRMITCFPDGEELLKVYEPEKFQIVFLDIIVYGYARFVDTRPDR